MRISDWSSDVFSSDLVWLLQRSGGRPGARLGKTTGWVHRATLKAKGVRMLGGVEYLGVDDDGLRVRVDGSEQMLAVDHVVVCAGQEPRRDLMAPLQAASVRIQVIGGADRSEEHTSELQSLMRISYAVFCLK